MTKPFVDSISSEGDIFACGITDEAIEAAGGLDESETARCWCFSKSAVTSCSSHVLTPEELAEAVARSTALR